VARDGTTLACAHAFTPPQAAIDACASKASGDACTLTGRSGASLDGTCGNGPHGTSSVLACGPAGHFPDAATACAGLAAGAACSLSAGHEHSDGTCTADSTGAVLCAVACHVASQRLLPDDARLMSGVRPASATARPPLAASDARSRS
jgi:hypothetical protein